MQIHYSPDNRFVVDLECGSFWIRDFLPNQIEDGFETLLNIQSEQFFLELLQSLVISVRESLVSNLAKNARLRP